MGPAAVRSKGGGPAVVNSLFAVAPLVFFFFFFFFLGGGGFCIKALFCFAVLCAISGLTIIAVNVMLCHVTVAVL